MASLALQKSHGKPLSGVTHSRSDAISVEFDGEKDKLNKYIKDKDDERRKERRRRESEKMRDVGKTPHVHSLQIKVANGSATPAGSTPHTYPRASLPAPTASTSRIAPPHPNAPTPNTHTNAHAGPSTPIPAAAPVPISPARIRRPPAALVKARLNTALAQAPVPKFTNAPDEHDRAPLRYGSASAMPPPWAVQQQLGMHGPQHPHPYPHPPQSYSPHPHSYAPPLQQFLLPQPHGPQSHMAKWGTPRTPSPPPQALAGMHARPAPRLGVHVSPGVSMGVHASPGKGKGKGKGKDEGVFAELAGSSFDHVRVDAAGLGVTEVEIRGVFTGFEVDKVRPNVHYSLLVGSAYTFAAIGTTRPTILVYHFLQPRRCASLMARRFYATTPRAEPQHVRAPAAAATAHTPSG